MIILAKLKGWFLANKLFYKAKLIQAMHPGKYTLMRSPTTMEDEGRHHVLISNLSYINALNRVYQLNNDPKGYYRGAYYIVKQK